MQSDTPRRRRRSQYAFKPAWLTPKRGLALTGVLLVLLGAVWGTRVVFSLGGLFNTDPATTVKTLFGIQGDSQVDRQVKDLKRINIALYGYGGPGHDGPYLTDSIMVVSIQPQPSGPPRVVEISIPRDWWVPIDLGNGRSAMGRVNEAYSAGQIGAPFKSDVYTGPRGGGALADATLERMLGLHIDYFVGVDFDAFKQAVDAVGGIDVNVPHTFTDNDYPSDTCDNGGAGCRAVTVHFDQGMQHMDGATALQYARSRKSSDPSEGSNFARNKRQQLVMAAVKTKVLSVGGITKINDLLGALHDHIILSDNLQLPEAKSLYELTKDVDPASIVHISVDDSNFVYECGNQCDASVEFPHDRTFASMHHFALDGVFVPAAALTEASPVSVVDASGRGQGAQTRWTSLLGALGLKASDDGRTRTSAATHVIDTTGGSGRQTAEWLAQYFGVTVETAGAAGPASRPVNNDTGQAATGTVTVVLGQDEERAFNNPAPGLYR